MGRSLVVAAVAAVFAGFMGAAGAAPVMYVDDSNNNLLKVDVATGAVSNVGLITVVGQQVTDIAFSPTGDLWAITFSSIWSVNKATAAAAFVGNHGISNGNALVFAPDGTLYAAGASTNNLFTINTSTGAGTSLGNMGAASGGDLAFNAGNLYLATTGNQLRLIDIANLAASTNVGAFGVANMFGIATGDDGLLYGVANRNLYTVNTSTGAATFKSAWVGFGTGFGQSFVVEAGAPPEDPPPDTPVPAPASAALMLAALGALTAMRRS